ncbi:MAG: hypothetical protein ABL884_04805, partial [Methyloglobulus sp.]
MLARLYLVYFLSLFASISFADEANWNCQQDKNSKEWVCVGSSATASEPSKPIPKTLGKPIAQGIPPKPANDRAMDVTPFKRVKPEKAEVTEKAQSYSAKPSKNVKPVVTEIKETAVEKPTAPIANPISDKPLNSPVVSEVPPPVLSANQKPVPASNKPAVTNDARQR